MQYDYTIIAIERSCNVCYDEIQDGGHAKIFFGFRFDGDGSRTATARHAKLVMETSQICQIITHKILLIRNSYKCDNDTNL
jgi:uncharacterized membrane-anchored protein